jgi:hypothetical protein
MLSVLFSTVVSFAQFKFNHSQFTEVKSYPIERVYFHSNDSIDGLNVISFEGGWYMAKVDNLPSFAVKMNSDCTKAIILGSFWPVSFTVVETDSRLTLYNEKPYFGFVYDKKYKALYHFTSKKYYRRVRKHIKNYPIL